jgi:hypothetical protein
MCLNVFIDIVIEFHHHVLLVTFLPCTPTYTFFFSLYNDSLPNMLYHYIPFFPFPSIHSNLLLFWHKEATATCKKRTKNTLGPTAIHSNFHTIYPYFSCLYITPHSTFHIPCRHWLHRVWRSPSCFNFTYYTFLMVIKVHLGPSWFTISWCKK